MEAGALAHSRLEYPGTFGPVAAALRGLAPVDHFMIVLERGLDAVFVVVEPRAGKVSGIPLGAHVPFKGSFLERLKEIGQSYVIPDLSRENHSPEDALIHNDGMRSCVRIPLYSAGRFLGMLALASRRTRAFRPTHLPYLESLALQVAHTAVNIERYQKCQAQNGRLAVIVREVHHRVKNNLQGVIGLLGRYRDEHPPLAPVLNHAIGQLHAMAEVHNLLSRHTRETVGLTELIGGICAAIGKFCPHRLESDLDPSAQEIIVSASEAVPIALVLNELIQNAIDHGYPDGRQGVIRVTLAAPSDTVTLRIGNDGIPPPAVDAVTDAGFGMGLDLVRTLLPEKDAAFRLFHEGGWTVAEVVFARHGAIFLKEQTA